VEGIMSARTTGAVAGIVALVVILGGRWWRSYESARYDLQVAAKELAIGDVWLSEKLRHTLTIRNSSKEEVHITGFDTSCSCTSVAPAKLVLAPGESQGLDAVIDPLRIIRENRSASAWPLSTVPTNLVTEFTPRF
jgi:hypothetical protein